MTHAQILDPLRLPLTKRRVIEASAGTGKTWTLAALYVRLVLGHARETALLPPQILVMTFTEAATAELRDRIRARLREAAIWFDHHASQQRLPQDFKPDDFLIKLLNEYRREEWPACSLKLSLAADWMDESAIYTIHGWSRRMLSQYALNTHILFDQTHLEDAQTLLLELMQDYWRKWIYPLTNNALSTVLPWLHQSPENALLLLNAQWQKEDKKPTSEHATPISPMQIVQIHNDWESELNAKAQRVKDAWSPDLTQTLQAQKIPRVADKNKLAWLEQLQLWLNASPEAKTDKLHHLGYENLNSKDQALAQKWEIPLKALDDFLALKATPPDGQSALLMHLSATLREQYSQAKNQRAAFDFSDLLQQLYQALTHDDGTLAQAIRTHYPVALVDEFQDTDPWQYGSLDRIYAPADCTLENALIMIGDPKQAIYSFRGADLATYLQARAQACALDDAALHTLTGNFRSSEGLVNAVNHLFQHCHQPFGSHHNQPIDFIEVQAKGSAQPLTRHGNPVAALNFWHLSQGEDFVKSAIHLSQMAQHFANEIAQLLNEGAAQPSEMAVLVRSQSQAMHIQQALRERGIASVYLSDASSVYSSEEALSLWRFLRACIAPNHLQAVRGALASVSWSLTREELEYLLNHESAWQAQVEQFHQWQQIWLTHGVLPLLHQWLHAPLLGQSIAQRLLKNADGERSLSNLLHLGELLQHASARLQGSAAVLRHLEQHIIQPPREVESQKSRLETDDQCVQIITYHKSKGLQYPLVFIPFAGSFRYDSQSEQDDDEEPNSAEEDMRLLYVALTRAQRAMWVGLAETQKDISKGSATSDPKRSAVSVLFEREVRGDLHRKLQQRVTECADMALKTLLVDEPLTTVHYTQANTSTIHVAAQRNQRGRFNNWWIASYSTLTKGLIPQSVQDEKMDDTASDTQGEDGTTTLFSPTISLAPPTQRWQEIAGGARFGSFLHELLEWQSQNGWPLGHTNDALLEKSWRQLFLRKTQWMGIDQTQAHTLHEWIEHLVTVTLKLPDLNDVNQTSVLQLQQLDALQSQTEMAFHLPANQVSTQWLDQCIRKHIFADAPRPALQTRELNGMLTGFMDLVFTHQGRFWIMDYKSNKLPQYNEDSLTETVLEKRYDVQYVLYTLALHRLLKTRLQNYDYDQHIGAAVYFFLRGVDEPNQGLHIMRPPRELIESLDNAFAGEVLA